MDQMRKATKEDVVFVWERICDLEQTMFDFEKFAKIFNEQLLDEKTESLIYELDGKPVGYATIRYGTYLHHCATTAELIELDLANTSRSQGLGKRFLEQIEELVKQEGCVELALATNQKRKRAHRFYEKNGMIATHYTYTKNLENE